MQSSIESGVFSLVPETTRLTLVVKGLDNSGESEELYALLKKEEANVRGNESFADIKAHPALSSWREAFQCFGFNPNKYPPSIANLIKRTRNGKDLPFINKLVCIFNIISLRYCLPAGADDLNCVIGDLVLSLAHGDERYVPLGGGEEETPLKDEVILYDSGSKLVFCRAWCWKNGDTSKVTEQTKNVAINLDILPPISVSTGLEAASALKELVQAYCGGTSVLYTLDAANPVAVFA